MQHLNPGVTLQNGKYRIERVLGQGGFGFTYLAEQRVTIEGPLGAIETSIKVTIKEFFMKDLCDRDQTTYAISVGSVGTRDIVERFRLKFVKEAHNISKLQHPNIIRVLDVFEENSTAYYVMEYIDGGSLSELIKRKTFLSERETLDFTFQIAQALKYIHSQRMNHLDIKPANIMLRKNGTIVLIDFGLSKNFDESGEQTTTTPVGISVGYAPIEQSRSGGIGTFSPQTDIYSLGATMFKMLTGTTPPEATIVFDEGLPDFPRGVSQLTVNAITKAMYPQRKMRYQDIDEFMQALKMENPPTNGLDRPSITLGQDEPECENTLQSDSLVMPKFLNEDDNEATRFISVETVIKSSISNEELVDLGLSVKWCSRNLGATNVSDAGQYCKWDINDAQGCADISRTEYDVASVQTSGRLRMPTRKEFKELIDRCRWSWQEYKGVWGCKVTGPSGKSIFLPAAGKKMNNRITRYNAFGYYWTSTADSNRSYARYLYFSESDYDICNEPKTTERTIRPVSSD